MSHIAQRDTVRLISTGRLKDPALLPLTPTQAALDALASLESATNRRLRAEASGLPDLAARELVWGRPSAVFINAAFAYTRRGGNRFNDEGRGAWYCGFEVETALAEVSYHLTRELEAIQRFENVTDYAELFADFIGPFHDLSGWEDAPEACLDPNPEVGYPAGQALAREFRAAGGNGIVYPSVRRAGGTCLVAFRPDLVQNLREGGTWRLAWQGSVIPVVTRANR